MYVVTSDQIPSNIKGVFFVVDPPGLFWIFYRVMKVFASAETLSKFKFVTSKGKACTAGATGRMHPEFAANFEADQLEEDYGGTLTSNWDAEAYFAEEERQAALLKDWTNPPSLNRQSTALGVARRPSYTPGAATTIRRQGQQQRRQSVLSFTTEL